MNYKKGDIILVEFEFTDFSNSKVRPAIILEPIVFNGKLQDYLICFITSRPIDSKYKFQLTKPTLTKPLDKTSSVFCVKMATIQKDLVNNKISSLTPSAYTRLVSKIRGIIK